MLNMVHYAVASILFILQATTICTAQDDSPNPALGKMATQSGMYAGRDASRAVDGYLYSQPDSRHCSSVSTSDPSYRGNKGFAWWQVDLADIYTVYSVTVFNTDDKLEWQFLYNFTVYVSYGDDISDAASRMVCQWVQPNRTVIDGEPGVFRVLRNDSYTVNCTVPLVGQYVTIKRTGGLHPDRMTLCEVEVEGTRYYSCDNCLGYCNSSIGCTKCNPGFLPPSCTIRTDGPRNVNTTTYQDGKTNEPVSTGGLPQTNSSSKGPTSGVERLRGTRASVLGFLFLLVVLEITKRRDRC